MNKLTIKPLVLIIEGIDHIGKTTMINQLMDESNALYKVYGKTAKHPENKLIYYRDLIQLNTIREILPEMPVEFLDKKHGGILYGIINTLYALRNTNTSFIFDRLHLSGAAYAIALRDNKGPFYFNKIFEDVLREMVGDFYDIKLATFIVNGSDFPKNDEAVNAENLEKANKAFERCFNNSLLTKEKTELTLTDGISDIIEKYQQTTWFQHITHISRNL